jgi:hypothetical protein
MIACSASISQGAPTARQAGGERRHIKVPLPLPVAAPQHPAMQPLDRRHIIFSLATAGLAALALPRPSQAAEMGAAITVLSDAPGTGTTAARAGDLLLVHWVGTLTDGATVFDSTRGEGLTYRDGGAGKTRPAVVRLGGAPTQPGVCLGLQEALSGMRIGGRRTVTVPAALGFGNQPALAPYAIVPGQPCNTRSSCCGCRELARMRCYRG